VICHQDLFLEMSLGLENLRATTLGGFFVWTGLFRTSTFLIKIGLLYFTATTFGGSFTVTALGACFLTSTTFGGSFFC
jgi:hypothetical protein